MTTYTPPPSSYFTAATSVRRIGRLLPAEEVHTYRVGATTSRYLPTTPRT